MINNQVAHNPYEFSFTLKRKLQRKIGIFFIFIIIVSIITHLFLTFILYPVSIHSDSMSPLLEKNSQVFVSPFINPSNPVLKDKNLIQRGDLVLLNPLNAEKMALFKRFLNGMMGFITFHKFFPFSSHNEMSSQKLLRRVVGLPGDTIYLSEYTAYIKSESSQYFLSEFELTDTMYDIQYNTDENIKKIDQSLGVIGTLGEIVLGENEYFVLADNRISGLDSRIWGSINEKDIGAKALLRYFPFQKMKAL